MIRIQCFLYEILMRTTVGIWVGKIAQMVTFPKKNKDNCTAQHHFAVEMFCGFRGPVSIREDFNDENFNPGIHGQAFVSRLPGKK